MESIENLLELYNRIDKIFSFIHLCKSQEEFFELYQFKFGMYEDLFDISSKGYQEVREKFNTLSKDGCIEFLNYLKFQHQRSIDKSNSTLDFLKESYPHLLTFEVIDTIQFFYSEIQLIISYNEQLLENNPYREKEPEESPYSPQSYKYTSNRVYLCQYLGIIPKLQEHFKFDNNVQLIEFLFDLGIFSKSDNRATIDRAIKEIKSNRNTLTEKNFKSIQKEYPKLDPNLLK